METSDFKITLLGGFSISYKGKVYVCDTGSSKKVFNLLQYLIVKQKKHGYLRKSYLCNET